MPSPPCETIARAIQQLEAAAPNQQMAPPSTSATANANANGDGGQQQPSKRPRMSGPSVGASFGRQQHSGAVDIVAVVVQCSIIQSPTTSLEARSKFPRADLYVADPSIPVGTNSTKVSIYGPDGVKAIAAANIRTGDIVRFNSLSIISTRTSNGGMDFVPSNNNTNPNNSTTPPRLVTLGYRNLHFHSTAAAAATVAASTGIRDTLKWFRFGRVLNGSYQSECDRNEIIPTSMITSDEIIRQLADWYIQQQRPSSMQGIPVGNLQSISALTTITSPATKHKTKDDCQRRTLDELYNVPGLMSTIIVSVEAYDIVRDTTNNNGQVLPFKRNASTQQQQQQHQDGGYGRGRTRELGVATITDASDMRMMFLDVDAKFQALLTPDPKSGRRIVKIAYARTATKGLLHADIPNLPDLSALSAIAAAHPPARLNTFSNTNFTHTSPSDVVLIPTQQTFIASMSEADMPTISMTSSVPTQSNDFGGDSPDYSNSNLNVHANPNSFPFTPQERQAQQSEYIQTQQQQQQQQLEPSPPPSSSSAAMSSPELMTQPPHALPQQPSSASKLMEADADDANATKEVEAYIDDLWISPHLQPALSKGLAPAPSVTRYSIQDHLSDTNKYKAFCDKLITTQRRRVRDDDDHDANPAGGSDDNASHEEAFVFISIVISDGNDANDDATCCVISPQLVHRTILGLDENDIDNRQESTNIRGASCAMIQSMLQEKIKLLWKLKSSELAEKNGEMRRHVIAIRCQDFDLVVGSGN
mmetsp:Transcript_20475/g.58219  ORF Transcript_20475/g.58219 Transcript_20475/m.58219 type:complete len:759 (-) Transcript_20475:27-2303(-)